jgi:hypothetical protein
MFSRFGLPKTDVVAGFRDYTPDNASRFLENWNNCSPSLFPSRNSHRINGEARSRRSAYLTFSLNRPIRHNPESFADRYPRVGFTPVIKSALGIAEPMPPSFALEWLPAVLTVHYVSDHGVIPPLEALHSFLRPDSPVFEYRIILCL